MKKYCLCSLLAASLFAAVPRLVRFSGTANDANGVVTITFALYSQQTGGSPLWSETQKMQTGPGGHYSILLGTPATLFTTGQAHWLGVSVADQPEQPRVLLASAPYALKANDAETLGGLPPSAFLLAAPAVSVTAPADAARAVSPDTTCAKITSDGTAAANQVAKFSAACTVEPSAIFESSGDVGIGTTTPAATLDVKGTATLRSTLTLSAKGAATAGSGANSNPLDLLSASYSSPTDTSINQHFRWQAEAAANNTASPAGTLNLLYAEGSAAPAETGLTLNGKGLLTFAAGQTFPGAGTITGLTAGSGLTGGGTSGAVTVGLTHACATGQALQWNGSKWACAVLGAGTITGVSAGAGLTGGGSAGNIALASAGVLALSSGTGIASTGGNAPAVSLNASYTDARYLQLTGGTLGSALGMAANGLTVAGNQLVLAAAKAGISTATPGAPLEVAGNVKISGAGNRLTFPDGTTQGTAGQPAALLNPLQVGLLKWFPAYQSSATFGVGVWPIGVAFDGTNIWVANQDGTVTKLLASTGSVVGTYNSGVGAIGLVFDGTNMWVANANGNAVTKLAASTGATVGTYSVGSGPWGIAFDGANLWVTSSNSNYVSKVAASNGTVLGSYTVGSSPLGVVFDGANIWVANAGSSTVSKLRASDGACVATCTFNVGSAPEGIAFDGADIWVTSYFDNTVTKLLASTGTVLGTYNVGTNPVGVVFDGACIWVTNSGSNSVTKLLASTGALLGTFNVGMLPQWIAFDGANVWVTSSQSNIVSKL